MVITEEFDHARRRVDQVPSLLGHHHLNEDVAGVHAAFRFELAAVTVFLDLLNRQKHFAE